MSGGSVYLSRAAKRAIAASAPVQRAVARKAAIGKAAFQAAAPVHTGRFKANVRIVDARGPDGTPGKRIESYPDHGGHNPNAPVPIEFGTRHNSRGAHAMQAARAAMER